MKSDCNESQPCQESDARVDLESDLLDCTDEERREIILFLRAQEAEWNAKVPF
jgi:hypothetical protein